jgi:putative SOS response-associated peptidase YedK
MCGRIALFSPPERLSDLFGVSMGIGFKRRYNIAPQTEIEAVALDGANRSRAVLRLRWGLVPSWAKDETIGRKLVNARAETAATKPAFRHAIAHNRVLVPADGYYDWQPTDGHKQPWFIRMKDQAPFAIAGMHETWEHDGRILATGVVLTTAANKLVEHINGRMPVIVARQDWDAWLDPENKDFGALLGRYPPELMETWRVGRWVNNPTYDTDRCIQPLSAIPPNPSP